MTDAEKTNRTNIARGRSVRWLYATVRGALSKLDPQSAEVQALQELQRRALEAEAAHVEIGRP